MFRRILLFAAFCTVTAAPVYVHAQAAPADVFNQILSNQEKEFIDAADAMPADKFSYAPTSGEFKGVRTFGGQAAHVAAAAYYFFDKWNVPNAKDPEAIGKLTTKPEIMQALRDAFAYEHAAIGTITAANAFTPAGSNHSTRAGIAASAMAHTMDHYGQMVEYLRMNGIVPPASRKSGM